MAVVFNGKNKPYSSETTGYQMLNISKETNGTSLAVTLEGRLDTTTAFLEYRSADSEAELIR